MTAISLYISTCRYVMQADAGDLESWSDLHRYLPFLRQALSCCVCSNIISKPKGPSHSECLHNVCAKCVGGKMRFKPACSWCKDYVDFRDNVHLRILVLCYKKLCEYIHSAPLWTELISSSANGETSSLVMLVDEAMEFEDDYVTCTRVPNLHVTMPILTPAAAVKPEKKRCPAQRADQPDDMSEGSSQEPPTLSPELETRPFSKGTPRVQPDTKAGRHDEGIMLSPTMSPPPLPDSARPVSDSAGSRHASTRMHKAAKHHHAGYKGQTKSKSLKSKRSYSQDTPFEPPSKRTRASSLPSGSDFARKMCRCARNNPPNRLTCLGQRCPCYSSRVPCVGCMCRGCRNPRKFDDVAFELESGRKEVEQSSDLEIE